MFGEFKVDSPIRQFFPLYGIARMMARIPPFVKMAIVRYDYYDIVCNKEYYYNNNTLGATSF